MLSESLDAEVMVKVRAQVGWLYGVGRLPFDRQHGAHLVVVDAHSRR